MMKINWRYRPIGDIRLTIPNDSKLAHSCQSTHKLHSYVLTNILDPQGYIHLVLDDLQKRKAGVY
jgi:hypothetical protein